MAYAPVKARPSPKPQAKVKKRDIPPTLPIGSPYLPNVNVPEPATLIGDETGTEYIRMGDNPNGPEQLQVTPPNGGGARMPVGRGGPVSMALGGTATVGGSKYNPTKASLDMNRWRKRQQQGIFGARKNVADLSAVAKANTIRDSENYKYAAAGVAAPARINLPRGVSAAGLNPSVAANFQTEAQRLEQEYSEENALRSLDLEADNLQHTLDKQAEAERLASSPRAAGFPVTTGRPPGGGTPAPTQPASMPSSGGGGGGGGSSGAFPLGGGGMPFEPPPGMEYYRDPVTGAPRLMQTSAADILRQRQAGQAALERRYPDPAQAPAGTVYYDNPFTDVQEREILSPAEAAMRKARDQDLIEQEYGKRYPGAAATTLSKLTLGQLTDAVATGRIDLDTAISELVAKGYTPEAAALVIEIGLDAASGGPDIAE